MLCAVIKGPTYLEAYQQIERILPYADAIELRLDCFESIDEIALRELQSTFSIPLIFTLRSLSQGGEFGQSQEIQIAYLHQLAVLKPSYLDVESHIPEKVIQAISCSHPEIKLILSYHNLQGTPENLDDLYQEMQNISAYFYKIAVWANTVLDAMRLLVWSKNQDSKLIAISMGAQGQISRILGPIFNHPVTFASVEEDAKNLWGQLSAKELAERYHYPKLTSSTEVYGLIGDPVDLSISDETHNAFIRELGLNAVYVKIAVKLEELPLFLELAKKLSIRGLSVTMPLKERIVPFVTRLDAKAQKVGAVNTLSFQDNHIFGFNTDGIGALEAIEAKKKVEGKRIVVIGAGGAAKAIIYEAVQKNAQVTILNRSFEKAHQIAHTFGCEAKALNEIEACTTEGYDILINCSPIEMPIRPQDILPQAVIMDIKTRPKKSLFLKVALDKGCQVIFGYQMFIQQALGQFRHWFPQINLHTCREILEKSVINCLWQNE
ncbi:shikimate dehydrogenase [Parachlamydia sp. AcF125]|uniref:shikimate dehydrogenase n=1 Tax=Parachlamydia sp. AcF125 TaxID=2795736 RepID=UPI001BC952D6|nr:shikimate dehydrogenase [Parachlamydia sp. AcF125]MBS4168955.1 Shikimate dehydrogenase (NADP(+)) [Parachlamydia sp. AcF125]